MRLRLRDGSDLAHTGLQFNMVLGIGYVPIMGHFKYALNTAKWLLIALIAVAALGATYHLLFYRSAKSNGLDGLLDPLVRPVGWTSAFFAFLLLAFLVRSIARNCGSAKSIGFAASIMLVATAGMSAAFPPYYGACDYFTKELGGGIKSFRGEHVKIEFCSTRDFINYNLMDAGEIRMRIYFLSGRLWAERFFTPHVNARGVDVTYGSDFLRYDDEGEVVVSMDMPPSYIDWVSAKLPRLWPF